MCGIAGILNLDGRPVQKADVEAITRALAHRGPDGEGAHVDGPVGLGHRRLAILDLSEAGAQPMPCIEGRYRITFNGEIFNFVEQRRRTKCWTLHDCERVWPFLQARLFRQTFENPPPLPRAAP